jgi:NAD(P)-dependent dehydrogenase (short-subunit alcohol dehydrogenase family)
MQNNQQKKVAVVTGSYRGIGFEIVFFILALHAFIATKQSN